MNARCPGGAPRVIFTDVETGTARACGREDINEWRVVFKAERDRRLKQFERRGGTVASRRSLGTYVSSMREGHPINVAARLYFGGRQ
ncbi:hypothetical protein CYMTET_33454, partial [Cymbomonas tetramitiformis]